MSELIIPLEKLQALEANIIKEIEESAEGKVSNFRWNMLKAGCYNAIFVVTYVASVCFPRYNIMDVDFDKKQVCFYASPLEFSCVRSLSL